MAEGNVIVAGSFRLPLDKLGEARPMMLRVISASCAEPGCLFYSYAEDIADPGLIRVSERWRNRSELAAHFTMPHMTHWIEERASLGITDRNVTAFTVTGTETL